MANKKKPQPKDKHKSKWWMKRNEARSVLQRQYADKIAKQAAGIEATQ